MDADNRHSQSEKETFENSFEWLEPEALRNI